MHVAVPPIHARRPYHVTQLKESIYDHRIGGRGSDVYKRQGVISTAGSSVTVMVLPTDEEYMIACDVERLAK